MLNIKEKLVKYFSLKALAVSLTAGLSGFWGSIASMFLTYLFNWMAKKGIYFINIGATYIQTNMEKKHWEQVAEISWQLKDDLDAGKITITEEERKKHSAAFRAAFRKFAVYSKVRN